MPNGELIIYQTEDGKTRLETRLEDETVWLTIDQMSELFQKSRSTINEHILNIYNENELDERSSMRKIGISDFSTKPTNFYNLLRRGNRSSVDGAWPWDGRGHNQALPSFR